MRLRLVNKLLLAFVSVSMIPMAIVGFVAYRQAAGVLRSLIVERLETLALERAGRVERVVGERRMHVVDLMAQVPLVSSALADLTRAFRRSGVASPDYRQWMECTDCGSQT
jgi:hypothetical protein